MLQGVICNLSWSQPKGGLRYAIKTLQSTLKVNH